MSKGRDDDRVLLYAVPMLEDALRRETFDSPLPRLGATQWRALGSVEMTRRMLDGTGKALAAGIPPIPATAWMAFSRTGDRQAFEAPYKQRRINLATLVASAAYTAAEAEESAARPATAVEPQTRDAITDYLWAICEETSWVFSAHLKNRLSTELPDPHGEVSIDLGSAMTGLLLAETQWILGELVHPEVSLRVRRELERRLIDPYVRYHDHHWMYLESNWNSVCHAGVVGAAIYLDTPAELLSLMIRKAEEGLAAYLAGFDSAGGSAEGIGYWGFGFGHFLLLNELIERRTNGRYSLLDIDRDRVERIAAFPEKVRLSSGRYVNFSDAVEEAHPEHFLITLVRDRFGVQLERHEDLRLPQFDTVYHNILAAAQDNSGGAKAGESDTASAVAEAAPVFFPDLGWFIARRSDDAAGEIVLATKGGHNGEEHNHNDLGTFILHADGYSFLADLGKDVYRRDHFTERRYEFLTCSAAGHSVPILNGVLQAPGREHYAVLVSSGEASADEPRHVEYDLTRAYPVEAGATSLRRRFEWSEAIVLTDDVRFEEPGRYQARFWTFVEPELTEEGGVRLFRPSPRGSLLQRAERHAGGALGVVLTVESSDLDGPKIEYVPRAVLGRDDETTGAYRIDFLSAVVRNIRAVFHIRTVRS